MSQPPGGSSGNDPYYQSSPPVYGGGQPPSYGPPQPAVGPPNSSGGLKSLFDFSFNTYATPSIIRIVYVLLAILIGLGTVVVFLSGLFQLGNARTAVAGIAFMLLAPLAGLVYLAIARITLESSVALVRAATDIKAIREEAARR